MTCHHTLFLPVPRRPFVLQALDDFVLSKLSGIDRTYKELTERLGDPDVLSNPKLIMEVSQERASAEEVVICYNDYTKAAEDLEGAKEFFTESSGAGGDAEMKEMAREEVRFLRRRGWVGGHGE